MKKIIIYFTAIIIAIVYTSCRDCEENYSNPKAAFWKNGVRQALHYGKQSKNSFYANSVFVSGNDVYVAGSEVAEGSYHTAILWKNGIAQSFQSGNTAISVFAVGENIYTVGLSVGLGYFNPVFWKNGIMHRLTDKDENLFFSPSVFVSNNDVYIAWKDKIWKNDEIIQTVDGQVTSIFVSDGNVYVAGKENNKATVWKNGDVQYILGNGEVSSLFVSDNNVYAASDNSVWKNGEVQYTFEFFSVKSIFISENDVYVATSRAVFKNGVEIFSEDYSFFSSVFVSGNDVYVAGYYSELIWICD